MHLPFELQEIRNSVCVCVFLYCVCGVELDRCVPRGSVCLFRMMGCWNDTIHWCFGWLRIGFFFSLFCFVLFCFCDVECVSLVRFNKFYFKISGCFDFSWWLFFLGSFSFCYPCFVLRNEVS